MTAPTEAPVKSCAVCRTTEGDLVNRGSYASAYWLCSDVATCVTSVWEAYLATKTPTDSAPGTAPYTDPATSPPAGKGQPDAVPGADHDAQTGEQP